MGDAVVIDPTFSAASGTTSTNAAPGAGSSPGAPASTGTGDSNAGRAGASGNSGPGTTAPGPGQSAQPSTPAQPADGADAAAGRQPATSHGSTANTQSQTPIAGQPGHPAARTPVRIARLIWVPQKGDTLTSGSVQSASAGRVTLQAGSSTFTALVDGSTALRRVDTDGRPHPFGHRHRHPTRQDHPHPGHSRPQFRHHHRQSHPGPTTLARHQGHSTLDNPCLFEHMKGDFL